VSDTPVIGSTASPARLPARPWRRWTAVLLLGVLSLNTACYSRSPITGTPQADTRIVLHLNDRGRLAYSERIGPSVREVEGLVESATDTSYTIRIAGIRYLDNRRDTWAGERFTFATENISRVRQHEFSRSRTTLLAVGIAAALTAAIVTASLIGTSRGGPPGEPDPGGGGSNQ
jgi:hypothetical protein